MKEAVARSLSCHMLVSNGTHAFKAYEQNSRFYLDPGSATGAFSIEEQELDQVTPSFVLMDLNPKTVSLYIYKLIEVLLYSLSYLRIK